MTAASLRNQRLHARREAYRDWAIITATNHMLLLTIAVAPLPTPVVLILAMALGVGLAIGAVTVLHDAGHRRFSRGYLANMFATQSAVPIGLWVAQWTVKHQMHHRLPAKYPDDEFTTAAGMLRIHPEAPMRKLYRFQHVYAWLVYCLLWPGDLLSQAQFLLTGRVPGSDRRVGLAPRGATFLLEKIAASLFLIPYFLLAGTRLAPFLGIAALFGGFLAGCLLIVGHVNIGLSYALDSTMPHSWTRYVVATTVSFSTGSRLTNWLTGGLSNHLAHHLRPTASRRELRQQYPDIKNQLEDAHHLAIAEFTSLSAAIRGHRQVLKHLGSQALSTRAS